ncbi:hypothetical protein E4U43_002616 [Claviceps pusilla]|uniref:DNA polymerase n=1 Tax=Claviceps pusilla TaxID=123648 RepID=A0A9P7NGQ8_9HYPO|nr:hypothetical protein E4U43_002616 [Claviceps pusilla]
MATSLQFPRMYLLTTHLEVEEYSLLRRLLPCLEDDVNKADILVGRIANRKRAEFELRRQKLDIRPLDQRYGVHEKSRGEVIQASENNTGSLEILRSKAGGNEKIGAGNNTNGLVRVVKLSWLTDSLAQQRVLPYDTYILFQGINLGKEGRSWHENSMDHTQSNSRRVERAGEDRSLSSSNNFSHLVTRRGAGQGTALLNYPSLLQRTMSEHEDTTVNIIIPDCLRTPYSCQRPTPLDPPNREFVQELRRIRTFRLLQGDRIGVRAYSTSIATLSAYPYAIQNPSEIELLPGCGSKIVEIYRQWSKDGCSAESFLAASDTKLSVLHLFYDIWGVGDITAREFYNRGWRNLNDIAKHGWQSLTRVQQIGLEYYDDFKKTISRQEVEHIAKLILDHARRIDPGFEMVIVGGYRRGKKENGDVDVVLSHREKAKTLNMVDKLVLSLESAGLITYTLSLWTNNSGREQQPLAWRGEVPGRGSGFDTLDKAMVVWQNKHDSVHSLHRRVDIIVSPWKTVGCALIGWTGGNTFQRDLRRYCKQQKGLKFDSSGIRRRSDGRWIDFEGSRAARKHMLVDRDDYSAAPDMELAEKRVFDGLDLKWLPATERCTG